MDLLSVSGVVWHYVRVREYRRRGDFLNGGIILCGITCVCASIDSGVGRPGNTKACQWHYVRAR